MTGSNGLKSMHFDRTINLGNVVSWVVMIGGFILAVSTNINATQNLENRFNERRPVVDAGLKTASDAFGLSLQNARDHTSLKAIVDEHARRLDAGYKDRRDSEERQATAIGGLVTGQALTNTKVDQLREDMQQLSRSVDRLTDKSLRRPSSESLPEPPAAVPVKSPAAMKAAGRRRAIRPSLLVSLTRSLERSFGKPAYRRRSALGTPLQRRP